MAILLITTKKRPDPLMKTYVHGIDQPPQEKSEIHEFDDEPSGRKSVKCVAGQMTDNTNFPATHKKGWVKQATAEAHRRNEREFEREVVKATRADSSLPQEPPRTIGGFSAV
jgi:hypothetical protein